MPAATSCPSRPVSPVVALDIGNVCLRLHPERSASRLGFASFAECVERYPDLELHAEAVETGRLSPEEFLHVGAALLQLSPSRIKDAWHSLIGAEIQGIAELVADMTAAGLRPVFFSDVSEPHFAVVRDKLSFLQFMHGAVLSYAVGRRKPDAAMYAALETKYCDGGVPCLYVDDKRMNIRAGTARGWHSYQFGTVAGLRRAFDKVLADGSSHPG